MRQNNKIRIDIGDLWIFRHHSWYVQKGPRPYVYTKLNGKTTYLHRLITSAPAGLVVDHIDGNPLNNARSNLRVCSQGANLAARRKLHNSSRCGYRGVSYFRRKDTYSAQVCVSGRKIHLGCFKNPEVAARVYDEAASILWGPFAVLNFGGASV